MRSRGKAKKWFLHSHEPLWFHFFFKNKDKKREPVVVEYGEIASNSEAVQVIRKTKDLTNCW
jgi:hypothetical protein